jgi:hypothetical protein
LLQQRRERMQKSIQEQEQAVLRLQIKASIKSTSISALLKEQGYKFETEKEKYLKHLHNEWRQKEVERQAQH